MARSPEDMARELLRQGILARAQQYLDTLPDDQLLPVPALTRKSGGRHGGVLPGGAQGRHVISHATLSPMVKTGEGVRGKAKTALASAKRQHEDDPKKYQAIKRERRSEVRALEAAASLSPEMTIDEIALRLAQGTRQNQIAAEKYIRDQHLRSAQKWPGSAVPYQGKVSSKKLGKEGGDTNAAKQRLRRVHERYTGSATQKGDIAKDALLFVDFSTKDVLSDPGEKMEVLAESLQRLFIGHPGFKEDQAEISRKFLLPAIKDFELMRKRPRGKIPLKSWQADRERIIKTIQARCDALLEAHDVRSSFGSTSSEPGGDERPSSDRSYDSASSEGIEDPGTPSTRLPKLKTPIRSLHSRGRKAAPRKPPLPKSLRAKTARAEEESSGEEETIGTPSTKLPFFKTKKGVAARASRRVGGARRGEAPSKEKPSTDRPGRGAGSRTSRRPRPPRR